MRIDIALREFERISQELEISEAIKTKATEIFYRYLKVSSMHGKTISTLISVCLYYCCENNEYAIPIEYFIEVTKMKYGNDKAFNQTYKEIISVLKLPVKQKKPSNYFMFFANKLNLDSTIQPKIKSKMEEFSEKANFQISKYNPKTVAVVIMYNVSKKNNYAITIKDLCEKARISQATFKNIEKEIIKYLN